MAIYCVPDNCRDQQFVRFQEQEKTSETDIGATDREIVTNEDNVPDKGFWEILEEMQNPKPVKQPVPTPKRKKKQQQVAAPSPFLAAEKVTDKQSPAGNRLVVPSTEEEIPLTDIEFDNAAELRKAVIYTEILNRKY